jgi:hypothetical protein
MDGPRIWKVESSTWAPVEKDMAFTQGPVWRNRG